MQSIGENRSAGCQLERLIESADLVGGSGKKETQGTEC